MFAISLFLWLLIWPLAPEGWSYTRLLTFVTLVSPPAALYAIPVERFVTLSTAQSVNVWFLAVVAVWRVALLFFYLFRLARLRWYQVIVAALLPLTVIVASLTALNLERAVFHIMSGMHVHGTASDAAYRVLLGLTMLSVWAFVPLLLAYLVMVVLAQLRRRRARAASAVPTVVEGAPRIE